MCEPTRVFTGAVLAGGASRRMGRDKAFVDVGGRPLASVAIDALRDAGAREVLAIGGTGLEAMGCRAVADRWPGEGPLGGLVTALSAATDEAVVVLSCDLPFVTAGAVRSLLEAGGDVAMPDGEPLVAVWSRSTCLPVLLRAFEAGERSPLRVLAGLDVRTVVFDDPAWAVDADTPAELPS